MYIDKLQWKIEDEKAYLKSSKMFTACNYLCYVDFLTLSSPNYEKPREKGNSII